MKYRLLFISVLFLVITLATSCDRTGSDNEQIVHQDTIPLTKYWEIPIPNQKVPQGLISLKAKDCGTCHQEIYREWQQSIHAMAYQDQQFQVEWKKDNVQICLNCHTPLQNQQAYIVKGLLNGDYKTPVLVSNPFFDTSLQSESITCATCHVRDGYVIGTIGITNAPHKTIQDIEFLSEKLCLGCHNVVDEMTATLVCTFETGDEWNSNWAKKEGKNCITCHMPETERSISLNMETRKSHFHDLPGSGIPKFFDMEAKALKSLEITEDNVNVEYATGDKLKYTLKVKNSYAGHSVPTGDPERFLLITFRLTDSQHNVFAEEQHRIGEKWQWYPKAKKLADNNLKPLEERQYSFETDLEKQGALTLIVEITKHRMTEENAKHSGLLGKYPLSIEVFNKQYHIEVE
jgi:cytochrome c554/c'-like protein